MMYFYSWKKVQKMKNHSWKKKISFCYPFIIWRCVYIVREIAILTVFCRVLTHHINIYKNFVLDFGVHT